MKRIVFSLAVVAMLALTACNTVHGIGQDIQRTGGAISSASKK
jgi:predicted small secreted protein